MREWSLPDFKKDIREFILKNFPNPDTAILDVGAGGGTYYDLLYDYYRNIDCVEVWKEYISNYNLEKKYRRVYHCDFKDFDFEWYDVIIMGDVLEHMDAKVAVPLVKRVVRKCKQLIVSIPYNNVQGNLDNNPYEVHRQNDLTDDIMKKRYPQLRLLVNNERIGIYVK